MPQNLLQQHFPLIRTRSEILDIIRRTPKLNDCYINWTNARQEDFLDFCTGAKGVKILYDSFFKEIFNAEYTPARLEDLLGTIIN